MDFVKLLKRANLIQEPSQGQYEVNPVLDDEQDKGRVFAGFFQILVGNNLQDNTLVYFQQGKMPMTDYGKEWKQDWDNYFHFKNKNNG